MAERQGVGVDEPVMQPVGEEETQVLAEALWLWLPLLDLDPVTVPVALLHGVALAVTHRVALGVSVEHPLGLCEGVDDVEGVKEELWVALLQRDGESDTQAVGEGELHGDSEAVRQALEVLEGLGEPEAEAQSVEDCVEEDVDELVMLTLPLCDCDTQAVAEREGVGVLVPEAHTVEDREGVAVEDSLALMQLLCDRDTQAEAERDRLGVLEPEVQALEEREGLGVEEPEAHTVEDREGVTVEERLALVQLLRDRDAQAVAEREGLVVEEAVLQALPVLEGLPLPLRDGVTVEDWEGVSVTVELAEVQEVPDAEWQAVRLWLWLGEVDAEGHAEEDLDTDTVAEAVEVRQRVEVLEMERERVGEVVGDELLLRHVVWLRLGDAVPVADAQVLELGETEWEAEEEPETELEEVSPSVLVKKRRIQRNRRRTLRIATARSEWSGGN